MNSNLRFSPPFFVLAAILFGLLGSVSDAQRDTRTIPVDEIRPGMRGYGLTVFRGTEPERFDVEVIDVLHNFRPDQDLILARTPHPLLDQAIAVGGMSGSPIYFDGRLAGAYAYGWPFGIEPVIGITPIGNMLREMDRPFRPDSFPGVEMLTPAARRRSRRTARYAPERPYLGGRRDAQESVAEHLAVHRPVAAPLGAAPAATPVMLGGMVDDVAQDLGETLEELGLVGLQAGGAGAPSEGPDRFVDGGAIGVQLIRGDISATAIGTVTHVGPGSRLVGFGHPMMNLGEIGLPTSTARVLHILASQARSFKIAEGLNPLGTLVHDRPSAIVVDSEVRAPTIPVRIRIDGVEDAIREEWNVEVSATRALAPMLIFSAMLNAIKTTASDATDVMFDAAYEVDLEGYGRIALEDSGYMASGPADPRALSRIRLFELLEIAYANPFAPSRLNAVDIRLSLRFGDETLRIVDASVASDEVDPGSTVPVRIVMRPYGNGDEVVREIEVRIPEHAAGETVEVEIAPGYAVDPERPMARDIRDLVRSVQNNFDSQSLVASLKMPSRGMRFRGHVTRSLPRSALDSLARVSGTGPSRPFSTYLRTPVPVGRIVLGSTTLNLRVRDVPGQSNPD